MSTWLIKTTYPWSRRLQKRTKNNRFLKVFQAVTLLAPLRFQKHVQIFIWTCFLFGFWPFFLGQTLQEFFESPLPVFPDPLLVFPCHSFMNGGNYSVRPAPSIMEQNSWESICDFVPWSRNVDVGQWNFRNIFRSNQTRDQEAMWEWSSPVSIWHVFGKQHPQVDMAPHQLLVDCFDAC